jgi:hypothetical protein
MDGSHDLYVAALAKQSKTMTQTFCFFEVVVVVDEVDVGDGVGGGAVVVV